MMSCKTVKSLNINLRNNGKKKIRKKTLIEWWYFEFDYEELQETSALQLTSQDAIDFKVLHILIKMDVSR